MECRNSSEEPVNYEFAVKNRNATKQEALIDFTLRFMQTTA